ncbi:NtaA/DmoA family FMN-dependent monooxygenase [Nocardioides sp. dk4132]|uniref:LLM class flavin-dependent oxidoreductase n=1 Tax=unclassified Nocardioides TaxID=2615069 RepID=UPI001297CDC2|nr:MULTISPECIES: LLM class flavin-dependent oxidoreductase [unclassified Nocardioides]MQW74855.1 NtaA/DmoA family FMN-dependent monooxygenase [Nocardioides sp. dk4132]QGA06743.1 NtaA/DmoA family FMN-dependent monooxygenase [Nocardioides sp. dk884]
MSLHLNLFLYPGGHHEAAWRHPDTDISRVLDITYYQALARKAEGAKLDAIFFADGPSLADNIRYASRFRLEPLTWMSAIAAVTSRIGLIGTASTTYTEPYNLARQFASLDHLSNGRAGWNIVTTGAAGAAANFGLPEHPPHADRYARAEEYLEVVTRLWDSWEDEALVIDQDSGIFADTDRIHRVDHVGREFSVAGPLNLPRSPQGRPVYVQAGSSDDGRGFAARWAEAIFTAHQTLASAQEFYADIKERARGLGRDPGSVLVLPGISPVIAATEAEARVLHDRLNALTQPAYSLEVLHHTLGVDLSGYDLDGPVPAEAVRLDGERSASSRAQLVVDIVEREQPTIRQLMHRLAGARGHRVVVGTAEQVADQMQLWHESGAADGFNVMPPWLTGGFDRFVEGVLPILRERGLFRHEYDGTTLREHLGLERPPSLFAHPTPRQETA